MMAIKLLDPPLGGSNSIGEKMGELIDGQPIDRRNKNGNNRKIQLSICTKGE